MIGVLQDILIDPEFVDMQSDFCRSNCGTNAASSCRRIAQKTQPCECRDLRQRLGEQTDLHGHLPAVHGPDRYVVYKMEMYAATVV